MSTLSHSKAESSTASSGSYEADAFPIGSRYWFRAWTHDELRRLEGERNFAAKLDTLPERKVRRRLSSGDTHSGLETVAETAEQRSWVTHLDMLAARAAAAPVSRLAYARTHGETYRSLEPHDTSVWLRALYGGQDDYSPWRRGMHVALCWIPALAAGLFAASQLDALGALIAVLLALALVGFITFKDNLVLGALIWATITAGYRFGPTQVPLTSFPVHGTHWVGALIAVVPATLIARAGVKQDDDAGETLKWSASTGFRRKKAATEGFDYRPARKEETLLATTERWGHRLATAAAFATALYLAYLFFKQFAVANPPHPSQETNHSEVFEYVTVLFVVGLIVGLPFVVVAVVYKTAVSGLWRLARGIIESISPVAAVPVLGRRSRKFLMMPDAVRHKREELGLSRAVTIRTINPLAILSLPVTVPAIALLLVIGALMLSSAALLVLYALIAVLGLSHLMQQNPVVQDVVMVLWVVGAFVAFFVSESGGGGDDYDEEGWWWRLTPGRLRR